MRDPQATGRASGYRAACRDIAHGYQRMSAEALTERARKVHGRYYADLDADKFTASWQFGYSLQHGTAEVVTWGNNLAAKLYNSLKPAIDHLNFTLGHIGAVEGTTGAPEAQRLIEM